MYSLLKRLDSPRFFLVALCSLVGSGTLHSRVSQPLIPESKKGATPAPASAEQVASEKLREDFRILRQALEQAHPGIYRYTPEAKMNQAFDRAEKALDRPMNVYEFYRIVAPAVAEIKCGHTSVRVNPSQNKGKLLIPLVVRALDGKLYVLRDLSSKEGTLVGNEVRAVNGMDANKIMQAMLAAMPGDGDVQTSRLRHLGGANFARELIDLLGLQSPYTVALWDSKQGLEHTVRLDGIEASKLQELRPKDSATLTFLDDGKIANLKINRFGGTANKKDLGAFIQECFREIDKKKTTALILDLRDNGGGADELGKLLLSFLIDEPFQYYDDLVLNGLDSSLIKYSARDLEVGWKRALKDGMLVRQRNGKYRNVKHPNWGIQQPSKPTYTGVVYILINGNSFSTTSEFLSHAHARKRATFIGEESGGGYSGNTSGPAALLTLPNTKLQAYIPLMGYYMAVRDYKSANHGVVPEYQIKYTIDELLEGKDKELAAALELARKRP
jgi:hypothetical protein